MKNYGEFLREIRIERGKTLKDIERATGISNSNLSRWENNKVVPSIFYCEQLADYYGISLDDLVG
ncbi:MAG: helix-turn-helix transcriptional regulator, partial [Clostridiales bacterium]|nr:helix-turn-helix transcriptional regulator [Clostridiales bacterium]